MVRKLIRNQSLRKQLRVRLPCPPLDSQRPMNPQSPMDFAGFLLPVVHCSWGIGEHYLALNLTFERAAGMRTVATS